MSTKIDNTVVTAVCRPPAVSSLTNLLPNRDGKTACEGWGQVLNANWLHIFWPKPPRESAISFVGPSNAHELAIARIVDQFCIEDTLEEGSAPDVIAALRFSPSDSDAEFVRRYIRWRIENPIWK